MSNGLAIFGEEVKSLRYARDRLNGNCLTKPWWDIPGGAPTFEKQMAEQSQKIAALENASKDDARTIGILNNKVLMIEEALRGLAKGLAI